MNQLDRYLEVMEIEGYGDVDKTLGSLSIDGWVIVYGVLLVEVLLRGVVWLMCVLNQVHAPSLRGRKGK